MRCENHTSPVLDLSTHPRLRWTLPDGHGDRMATYDVEVRDETVKHVVWEAHGTQQIGAADQEVLYDGPALKPSTSYTWAVRYSIGKRGSKWSEGSFSTRIAAQS